MWLNSPKTIAEVLDEIEQIQQELFSLQKTVEEIEKPILPVG
jgi:archaellum component FlaC